MRHSIAFVGELLRLGQPAWCLELLADGEGRDRLDEVFLARAYAWAPPPAALLSQVAPLKEAVLPLLGLCLATADGAPQHARRAQALLAAMCATDDIYLRLAPILPTATGSSLACENVHLLGRLVARRVERVPLAQIDPAYPAITHELARLLATHEAHADFFKTQQAVHRCRDLLGLRAPPRPAAEATRGGGAHATNPDRYVGRRGACATPDEYDPPGELSAGGQRHSNDHACIARVEVVPTPDELVAERFPSLPRNRPDARHHLPAGSIERLLDVHFRQLRHEAVYPLAQSARQLVEKCEQVQDIVRRRGSAKLDLQRQLGCRDDGGTTLFAFGGGAYMGVDIDTSMGVVHRFHVDEVRELQRRSLGYRRNAWRKGEIRLLTTTDMVLVLRTDNNARRPVGAVSITAAVIAAEATPVGLADSNEEQARGDDGSNAAPQQARLEIRLRFVDRSTEALAMFADVNGSFLLFDLRAGFFSFEPILESLREIDTLNSSPVLTQLALTREKIEPTMPDYISSREHLDFSSLLKQDAEEEDVAWSRRVAVDELRTHDLEGSMLLQRMTRVSRLDPGQMKAMLETLQRSMAITQGPPGIDPPSALFGFQSSVLVLIHESHICVPYVKVGSAYI